MKCVYVFSFFSKTFFRFFSFFFCCVVCGWSKYLLTYRGYVVHHRPFMYVLSNNGPRRLQFRCFFFSRVQCRPDALINAKNHFLKWCFFVIFQILSLFSQRSSFYGRQKGQIVATYWMRVNALSTVTFYRILHTDVPSFLFFDVLFFDSLWTFRFSFISQSLRLNVEPISLCPFRFGRLVFQLFSPIDYRRKNWGTSC